MMGVVSTLIIAVNKGVWWCPIIGIASAVAAQGVAIAHREEDDFFCVFCRFMFLKQTNSVDTGFLFFCIVYISFAFL